LPKGITQNKQLSISILKFHLMKTLQKIRTCMKGKILLPGGIGPGKLARPGRGRLRHLHAGKIAHRGACSNACRKSLFPPELPVSVVNHEI
jgi:hypothetical protein